MDSRRKQNNISDFLLTFHNIYQQYCELEQPRLPEPPKMNLWTGDEILHEKGAYISDKLRDKINRCTMQRGDVIYTFCKTRIAYTLYAPVKIDEDKMKLIFHVLNFIIYYCSLIQGFGYLTRLNVCLILSPFKKTDTVITDNGLSAYNVNSGFTTIYGGQKMADVLIYRYEEIVKVMIHEIIHAFDLDTKGGGLHHSEKNLMDYFGVQTPLHVNEAFTDTYAVLLNLALTSIYFHKRTGMDMHRVFAYLYDIEKKHMREVAYKALKIQGISIKNNAVQRASDAVVRETTHVISYYYLKYLTFVNIVEFLDFLQRGKLKLVGISLYVNFIENAIVQKVKESKLFRKLLVDEKKIINSKLIKMCRKVAADIHNLRMTCVDILNI